MKWEYQVREYQAQNLADLERALAAAGPDGWELVTIIPHPMPATSLPPLSNAIFKRPAAGSGTNVTVNVNVMHDGATATTTPA